VIKPAFGERASLAIPLDLAVVAHALIGTMSTPAKPCYRLDHGKCAMPDVSWRSAMTPARTRWARVASATPAIFRSGL
jgi:hypothetical protein